MGLIGEQCVTCSAAAENGKGLAGGWWRFWAEVISVVGSLTEHTADSKRDSTGEQPLGLYRRGHRRKFRAGSWRVVRGTMGIYTLEKGEAMKFRVTDIKAA